MAMLSAKPALLTSQYAANYRGGSSSSRNESSRGGSGDHHAGFFASPTESEFSEHLDNGAPMAVKDWDEDQVATWLRSINCSQYIDIFIKNNITGEALMELDRTALRELGVRKVGDQIRIANQTKAFRQTEYKKGSIAVRNRVSYC
jgi:mitogen-activated protein kinase kinase kinase